MPSNNRAVIAAAGSLKTQLIIDEALADSTKRVLITTYTNENLQQIRSRLANCDGVIPGNVTVMGWLTFIMNECARPYQTAVLNDLDYMHALNFDGKAVRGTPIAQPHRYFFDSQRNLYRHTASHFAVLANQHSDGLVIDRLGDMFDHIYVDEVQDMAGYDLDLLEALMDSAIEVTVVGDPRQRTFSTTNSPRNKQYVGAGIYDWFNKRTNKCVIEPRAFSARCNQVICDFADDLFPEFPRTTSLNEETTGHDGIFEISRAEAPAYVEKYKPVVLRDKITSDTLGMSAINFGISKGSTYDRVLIFPTGPMRNYLKTRDITKAGSKERFYVAVTRARFSVAFIV